MQCLLIGNFGVGNLGDEALKDYFLQAFPAVTWRVVSAQPSHQELARLPLGIRSFLGLRWLKTIKGYWQCDAVVFGGGSLFTDTESVTACILWWLHTVPARLFGKPIHFAFQGVGPFSTRVGEWFTRSALRSATTISVRDEASANRAKKMVKNTKIVQSIDPVIWLIEKEKIDICIKNILVLIPRKNSSEKFTKAAQKHAMSREWDEVRVVSMEPDNLSEIQYVKWLTSTLGSSAIVHKVKTLSDLLECIASASQVVSERYHGALPALMYGKPTEIIFQRDGDKLDVLQDTSLLNIKSLLFAQDYLKVYIY